MNRVSLALAGIIIALLAAAWTFWPRDKPDVGVSAPLPPAKEVKTESKSPVHPKAVNAYPDRVKEKLNLPDTVVQDPAKKVIATGKLETDDRPYTMTAVLDLDTGDAEVFGRADPQPWIGPGKRGAVRLTQWHNGVTQLDASHDLLRVKSLYAGVAGRADTSGETLVGAYVEYRW